MVTGCFLEVPTKRKVYVEGSSHDRLILFRYEDEKRVHTITLEEFASPRFIAWPMDLDPATIPT